MNTQFSLDTYKLPLSDSHRHILHQANETAMPNHVEAKAQNSDEPAAANVAQMPHVVRIDQSDVRVQKAIQAEQQLFEYYGLKPQGHRIKIKEFGIHVRILEVGSGPPVLLIPGGNGVAIEQVPLMAELTGYRLIAVNLPGGGMSDAIDCRQIDYPRLAVRVLTTILDTFKLERIPIIANSIGGLWAFWLALAEAERISRIVQVGCPAFIFGTSAPLPMRLLSLPFINRLLFPMAQPASADKVRSMLRMLLHSSREITQSLPEVLPEAFYRMFHLPIYRLATLSFLETVLTLRGSRKRYQLWAEQLSRIEQEVLFIWGANDPFGGVQAGKKAVQSMPHARLQVIDGGHVPYIDNPKDCARLIQEFSLYKETGQSR